MASFNRLSKNKAKKNIAIKEPQTKDTKRPQGSQAIPKKIADRIARRVVITTGIPTIFGMAVFICSYLLVSRDIMAIAPSLTLLASGSCFLLAFIGLTYGIISTSWEKNPGTLLGFEQIRTNVNRLQNSIKK